MRAVTDAMPEALPDLISPSLLSADFARLAQEVARVEAAGADWLHVDVMDGHFVPNLTIGPPVVEAIGRVSQRPLDVHLMISEPARYARAYAEAGAHVLTFHIEVARDAAAHEVVRAFRGEGVPQVGVSLNPDTPIESVAHLLEDIDLVLVMSVFPGFGGQAFKPEVLHGVRALREDLGFTGEIEMDGGIDPETIEACARAGANVFVSGTGIFEATDRAARIALLRRIAESKRS
ncbi:MAG TPA: ribulose-phosphate 3-epimerase [Planctomycetota bacterium]|nr:ribulose-phosphate 3-epimerase [Planctomycetota bacterium]